MEYGELGSLADRQLAEQTLDRRPRSTQNLLAAADRAIQRGPKVPANWLVRGRAQARLRRSAEAVSDFTEYLKLAGSQPKDLDAVAWHLVTEPGLSDEAYRQARTWAGQAVAAETLNVRFRTSLGAAQFRAGDKEAQATLQLAAVAGLWQRRNAVAAGYLLAMARARLAAPGDAAARAEARKSFDAAEAVYRKLANRPPDLTDLRFESADAIARPRLRYELDVFDATATLAADPKDLTAHQTRATAHFQLGRYAEAEADYDALIAAGPASDRPNHYRGHSRERRLRFVGAVEDYLAALKLTADNRPLDKAHLLNEVARIRALGDEKVRDAGEAVRRAADAVSLDPGFETYVITLAGAHVRAGNDKTAVRILEGVDDAKVTTPAAVPLKYLLLALVQHRQGRAEAAAASHERAQTEWRRLRAPALPEWTDYYTRTRAEVERALGPTAKLK